MQTISLSTNIRGPALRLAVSRQTRVTLTRKDSSQTENVMRLRTRTFSRLLVMRMVVFFKDAGRPFDQFVERSNRFINRNSLCTSCDPAINYSNTCSMIGGVPHKATCVAGSDLLAKPGVNGGNTTNSGNTDSGNNGKLTLFIAF